MSDDLKEKKKQQFFSGKLYTQSASKVAIDRCACIVEVHFSDIITKPYQCFREEKK